MNRKVLGLLLLGGVGITLLAGSIAAASGWKLMAIIAIGLLFCLGLGAHLFSLKEDSGAEKNAKLLAIIAVAVVSAAATWGLREGLDLNACIASGLVGIVGALVLPGNLAAVAYTASFVAMSSLTVLTGLPMVLCGGIVVGCIYYLTLPIYEGIGGKLGTIAAGAVLATTFFFSALGGM